MTKVKANNAYQFVRHCKNLAAVGVTTGEGLPEFQGLELWHKFNRIEQKAHRLTETACNRSLTASEEKQLERLEERARLLIREEYREQFFLNGDPRGYSLKLRTPQGVKEDGHKAGAAVALPEGFYQDWGGYGILAPEF